MPELPLVITLADFDAGEFFFMCLVVIVILAGGGALVFFVRRWMRTEDDMGGSVGFSLGELKRLQKTGMLTPEEYEKAKTQVVHATQVEAEKAAKAKNPPPRPPRMN